VQLSTNIKNSHYWMMKHSEQSDTPTTTLAVQTFRNTIVVSVFVGGISLTRASQVISDFQSLETDGEKVRAILVSTLLFCSFLSWVCVIRLASHMGFMVGTFFQMKKEVEKYANQEDTAMSRQVSSISCDFSVSAASNDPLDSSYERVSAKDNQNINAGTMMDKHFNSSSKMLRQMFSYFHFGFRFMFLSIPFIFYSVGPEALIITTIALLMFLYVYDYQTL